MALTRMEQGNLSNVKTVGGGVLEYRIDFGPGYRVYFGRDGDTLIILLAGGTKRRQQDDIAAAQTRWAEYKQQGGMMVLTHSFKETVKARAERDPVFRDALLTEAVDQFLAGDLDTGKPCCGTTSTPPSASSA
jgi:putative addiction module killer protein